MTYLLFLSIFACANVEKAETHARQYVAENYPGETIQNLRCEVGDSDGDGRVRCNLSLLDDGETHVEAVECPAGWLWQPFATTCLGIKGRMR